MAYEERDFRLRFATPRANDVPGNVDFTIDTVGTEANGFIADLQGEIGGQRVEPTRGRTVSDPMNFRIGESSDAEFTAQMANAEGRADILRRLVDVSMSTDEGSNWTVWATARVESVSEPEVGVYEVTLVDERMVEREIDAFGSALRFKDSGEPDPTDLSDIDVFHGADQVSLYPAGLRQEWAHFRNTILPTGDFVDRRVRYRAIGTFGDVVHLNLAEELPGGGNVRRQALAAEKTKVGQFIRNDTKDSIDVDELEVPDGSESHGDFRHTVINTAPLSSDEDGSNRELLAYGVFQDGQVGELEDQEDNVNPIIYRIYDLYVIWPGWEDDITVNLFNGDILKCYIWAPTAPASETTPHLIGGTGTNIVDLAKSMDDAAGVRKNDTAYDDLAAGTFLDVSFRIKEGQEYAQWRERNLFQPISAVPAVNKNGEIAPISLNIPQDVALADPPAITESDITEAFSWEHVSDDFVTRLKATWEAYDDMFVANISDDPSVMTELGADMLRPEEKTIVMEHDRIDQYGTVTRELSMRGIHTNNLAQRVADDLEQEIFNRFGDGPQRRIAKGLTDLEDRELGELVRLSGSIHPSIPGGDRGTDIFAQIVDLSFGLDGPKVELLDVGPAQGALAAPSISATKNTDRPKRAIDVTISDVAQFESYRLQVATNDTEPTSDSDLWNAAASGRGSETVTVEPLAAGETHWFRAQTRIRAGNRILPSSGWSSAASATTDALAGPTVNSVNTENGCTVIGDWTNGESNVKTVVEIDGIIVAVINRGQSRARITGSEEISPSTTFDSPGFEVYHRDNRGGTSPSDSQSFSTGAAGTAPSPGTLQAFGEGDEL